MKRILTVGVLMAAVIVHNVTAGFQDKHPQGLCSKPLCLYGVVKKVETHRERKKSVRRESARRAFITMAQKQKPFTPRSSMKLPPVTPSAQKISDTVAKDPFLMTRAPGERTTTTAWTEARGVVSDEVGKMPVNFGAQLAENGLNSLARGHGIRSIIPGLGLLALAKRCFRDPRVYPATVPTVVAVADSTRKK